MEAKQTTLASGLQNKNYENEWMIELLAFLNSYRKEKEYESGSGSVKQ